MIIYQFLLKFFVIYPNLNLFKFKVLQKDHPNKMNFTMYKNTLNGRIEYEPPDKQMSSFTGFIKLNKDPKIHLLNIENFIPRGSVIKSAGW